MLTIDYNSYRTTVGYDKRIRTLVLHYTAANFTDSIRQLTRGQVSAHYLLPAMDDPTYLAAGFHDRRVFALVDEQDRAWHGGVSHWAGRDNINDSSIGIEIVNLPSEHGSELIFPPYEPGQIADLCQLASNILQRYPAIVPRNVVGHADIAYLRKSDPGPQFPWQELARGGIGAWYEQAPMQRYLHQFTSCGLPERSELAAAFNKYGYAQPPQTEAAFRLLTRAFQMHFRPERHDGTMDVETAAILFALNERYT
jgi:N-acetylmuramoyl-L-alanine amidase